MQLRDLARSRAGAVAIGATILVTLGGVSGAFAASMITSQDIKNDTIRGDISEADLSSTIQQQGSTP